MELYCLTLFLNPENLDAFVAACRKAGFTCKEDEVTDQVGETEHCCQIDANGLHMVAGPANPFHKDHDYEIGITAASREEWDVFDAALVKAGVTAERIHEEDGTDIIIPQVEHGPFFCIMDRDQISSDVPLIRFEATMTSGDLATYEQKLKPLFGEDLTARFKFTEGDLFRLKTLEISSASGTIVL